MADWLETIVTVDPTGMDALLPEVRTACKIDGNDQDGELTGCMLAAIELVEKYCGIKLFAQTVEMRRADFLNSMVLPIAPLQSITSVAYRDATGATVILDASTFEEVTLASLQPQIVLAAGKSWPAISQSPQAIVITAVAGWASASAIPAMIRIAIQILVGLWFDNRDGSADDGQAIPPHVAALLVNHRRYYTG
jgi:uncharacterized phiE125 gp8 family phage protein